jgi:hypothetical protein
MCLVYSRDPGWAVFTGGRAVLPTGSEAIRGAVSKKVGLCLQCFLITTRPKHVGARRPRVSAK